ncbi:MAG: hypothetical protein JWM59_1550 [Verrucomicrobiales bacterium]|nr:hypothetical protein [Verrucomicrobiales bacterium]
METKQGLTDLLATAAAEGLLVDAAGVAIASASALPYGVVLRSDDPSGYSTVALPGYNGIIEMKCHSTAGTIAKGTLLVTHSSGGVVKADPATGARVVVGRAVEAGANSALVKAIFFSSPIIYTS